MIGLIGTLESGGLDFCGVMKGVVKHFFGKLEGTGW